MNAKEKLQTFRLSIPFVHKSHGIKFFLNTCKSEIFMLRLIIKPSKWEGVGLETRFFHFVFMFTV